MTTNDLDQAREWAESVCKIEDLMPATSAAVEVIQSLPDEWIDADKLRDEADRMEEGARNAEKPGAVEWSHGYAEAMRECAKHLRALLPAPQPRTLEDMDDDEREACQWMQADFDGEMVLLTRVSPNRVAFLHRSGTPGVYSSSWFHRITPLPDLPRMVWPDEEVSPEPTKPRPEDVPEEEPWIVECYGDNYVGTRDPHCSTGWALAQMDGTDATFAVDHEVTLVSRLVPEVKA